MDESIFEGTVVLEALNQSGLLDEFFTAVDSDDFKQAQRLLKQAGLDAPTISMVLKKMAEADGDH